ncbi:MFS transporter [Spelaeicoccus albus]|uniref:DHA2 family multidrug resistance protein-like MFS transporter n=1 Tax=Spelaeicoccus albus TaxID=1280376 RepID=A0A7Z0D2Q6_9MICO|nr:MFS transporter [Spelaeicoccus albus]NYI67733.1 DHA2 family multidrug resistance protein-like MFS transporter [Spelaeicoccus albus]
MVTSYSTRRSGARTWAGLGILTLAVLLLAIDGTVLALAIPALTADLAPSSTQILWIGDIYSFALAGLLVVMGNLADRIGRKRLLMFGSVGFGLSSLAAAFAPTPELLIVARTVLGISGATIMPSTLAIVRNLFPDARERTRAVAVWAAGATAGAAIGPIVGGALLEHFHWGSVFLINVPIMLIVVIGGLALLPESRDPGKGRIDLLSAVLQFAAIVPIVYAVKHLVAAGYDVTVIGGIIVGVAAGWWFIVRQRRLSTPLIDVALFRRPAFSGAVVADTVTIFGFVGLLFFFSQYLQLVRGLIPLEAGLVDLSASVTSVIVIALAGAAVGWLGRGRAIGAGLALAAAGLIVLAVAEGADHLIWIVVAFAVIGFGTGLSMTLNTDAIVSAAPPKRAGAASSVAETAYELGAALGIAVLGSLQNVFYRAHLPVIDDDATRTVVEDSLASATSHLDPSVPGVAGLLEQAREAFTIGMQWTSVIAAILVVAAVVIAWIVIPSGREESRSEASQQAIS